MQWKWLFFEPSKIFESNVIQKNKIKTKRKKSFFELENI